MNLSEKQKRIIYSDKKKVLVIASAAAGKTTVLKERIKHLLDIGVTPSKIVCITFTNAAAEEISSRLGEKGKDVFVGTIHSYANYLLRLANCETSEIIKKEEFDKLFNLVAQRPNCVEEVEHLLLDEAQDSNAAQFAFILKVIKPKNYMFVGDHRQSIYRWNGAVPELLIALKKESDVTVYDLNENYRNSSPILNFAKSLLISCGGEYIDNSVCMSKEEGNVIKVTYAPERIVETIKKKGDYKNWFVLARTNDEVNKMAQLFKNKGVPCDTFKKAELTNGELHEKMKEDSVKVLTIHTAKGLEADNVVVIGVNYTSLEEVCIGYVAATRARKQLVWVSYPPKRIRKRDYEVWA